MRNEELLEKHFFDVHMIDMSENILKRLIWLLPHPKGCLREYLQNIFVARDCFENSSVKTCKEGLFECLLTVVHIEVKTDLAEALNDFAD